MNDNPIETLNARTRKLRENQGKMDTCLAFVLGGGGARGAMQVGALRALLEAGYKPDLLVGTSIGAVNAAGLALWGANQKGITALEQAYQRIAEGHLMDQRLEQLAFHSLSGRPNQNASQRIAELAISMGITRDLRFEQVPHARLALIGSDLESGRTVVYGQDPKASVLEGLMASVALPPWFAPVEKESQLIIDGGLLSNLPIEPALALGATRIIALDLTDKPDSNHGHAKGVAQRLEGLIYAVLRRQAFVEQELACAKGVQVHHLQLRSSPQIPIWDFRKHRELLEIGYGMIRHAIANGWT